MYIRQTRKMKKAYIAPYSSGRTVSKVPLRNQKNNRLDYKVTPLMACCKRRLVKARYRSSRTEEKWAIMTLIAARRVQISKTHFRRWQWKNLTTFSLNPPSNSMLRATRNKNMAHHRWVRMNNLREIMRKTMWFKSNLERSRPLPHLRRIKKIIKDFKTVW